MLPLSCKRTIFLAAALTLPACTTCRQSNVDDWHVRVYQESKRTGICSLHHGPLVRRTVYAYSHFDRGTIDWDEIGGKLSTKYPNCLDAMYSRTRSKDFHKPEVVQFCPVCQQRFEEEFKRWQETHVRKDSRASWSPSG
jgi:hypothetical protein